MGEGSSSDEERIYVCKQELIGIETNTTFSYSNKQLILSLY